MDLSTISKVTKFIDDIPSKVKTLIIIILLAVLGIGYVNFLNKNLLKKYSLYMIDKENESELYTVKMAPEINKCVKAIAKADTSAFNVTLLMYHNSKKSMLGLRYIYLDYVTEAINDPMTPPLRREWKDLEYIYYEDELAKLQSKEYLRVLNVEEMRYSFPKLYERVSACHALAVAFYVIEGTESSIGLIVVFYKHPKEYKVGYYNTTIAPYIQKLSAILDYNNISDEMKNE